MRSPLIRLTSRGRVLSNEVFSRLLIPSNMHHTQHKYRSSKAVPIDLRSDTVTQPTPAMRHAMANAEVGDDVYSEDPTVNRLERAAAEIFGARRRSLCPPAPWATRSPSACIPSTGRRSSARRAPTFSTGRWPWSPPSPAACPRTVAAPRGILTWQHLQPAIAPDIYYRAQTGLICLENTHNMAGGTVTPVAVLRGDLGRREEGRPPHSPGRCTRLQRRRCP